MSTETMRNAAVAEALRQIEGIPGAAGVGPPHGPATPAEYRALEALYLRGFREGRESRDLRGPAERKRRVYAAAAKINLRKLAAAVATAQADLEAGRVPSASLTEIVTGYDRAVTTLSALDQITGEEGA